jgi:hypothetical protein
MQLPEAFYGLIIETTTDSLTEHLSCCFANLFPNPLYQGKEYVFIANSDNLGAIVDISIHIEWSNLHNLFPALILNIAVCSELKIVLNQHRDPKPSDQ